MTTSLPQGVKLARWEHPSTGERRIYVNTPDLPRGVKVWFTKGEQNVPMSHTRSDHMTSSLRQRIEWLVSDIADAADRDWSTMANELAE